MDQDRIGGIGRRIAGSIKEATGKLTGDAGLEAEGKADKLAGTVQNAFGGAKDAVRDVAARLDRDAAIRANEDKDGDGI